MKIGTLSLNINTHDFNYGAVLHSWAFQQYLMRQPDVESVDIINYTTPILEGQSLKHPIVSLLRGINRRGSAIEMLHPVLHRRRYKKFRDFIENNMTVSDKAYTQASLNAAVLPYDTIICESDVTWSAGFFGGHYDRTFFLSLKSMKNMNRIAYAPSMADGEVNEEQSEELKKLLKYPNHISCRETYAVDVLKKHTNKPVKHVVDPVLLLDAEDYEKITGKRIINDEYLLLYLPVDDNAGLRNAAKSYARKYGLKIIDLSTYLKKNDDAEVISLTSAGIGEFLSAIKYASCVFTNSFHAKCFSIIFNVEFYGFSRKLSRKVIDICELMGLKERYIGSGKFREQKKIDFEKVNAIWREKRAESEKWLKECLYQNKS